MKGYYICFYHKDNIIGFIQVQLLYIGVNFS